MIAYIGGKYRQAKWINSFIPNNIKTYCEIFGGAFWTYLKSDFHCDTAIYNDVNPFMSNLFACCCDPEFAIDVNKETPQIRDTFNEYKKDVLKVFNDQSLMTIPDKDIGVKYAYLVTQIFSGIMSDKANMVDLKGKYKSKYLAFAKRLNDPKIRARLNKVKTYNLSYEKLIDEVDDEDVLFYVDPPYYGTENLYGFHDFNITHHEHLAGILKESKAKWILSYYDFPELSKWFPKDKYRWEAKNFKKASAAKKGTKQTDGVEILVMNY